jgi:protein TonB
LDEVDPKKKEKEIIPLPKVQKPEPQQLKVIQSTKPVIVKEAAPEEMPPLQDEIEISKIGLANIDGGHDDDITAPPIQDKGRDILSKPQHKEDEKDKIFISVQIESQYKGGSSAWLYYLNKNLASNYPAKAVDDGIQGRVVIQFIVDQEGNVSDVKAISGPVELREAAIKVIRESGTWIPAIQNGRKVKSYKQQPITFQITE